jgi:hypothetical protein
MATEWEVTMRCSQALPQGAESGQDVMVPYMASSAPFSTCLVCVCAPADISVLNSWEQEVVFLPVFWLE